MELYEVKNGLERARLLLNELFVSIDIEGLKREIEGLTVQTLDEHFWNNQEQAKKIYNQLLKDFSDDIIIDAIVSDYEELESYSFDLLITLIKDERNYHYSFILISPFRLDKQKRAIHEKIYEKRTYF